MSLSTFSCVYLPLGYLFKYFVFFGVNFLLGFLSYHFVGVLYTYLKYESFVGYRYCKYFYECTSTEGLSFRVF